MKRLIAFAMFVLLMVMSVSASAEKKQWCDNSFKFIETLHKDAIKILKDDLLNDFIANEDINLDQISNKLNKFISFLIEILITYFYLINFFKYFFYI